MESPVLKHREVIPGDDRAIREALEHAHIPSLVAALVHLTGDTRLLKEVPRPVYEPFGGTGCGIPAETEDHIRDVALEAIKAFRDGRSLPASPSEATLREMMNFVSGVDIPDHYVPFLLEELDIDGDEPRAKAPEINVPASEKEKFHVLIIGAGMSGILTAAELKQAGIPYTIIEKNTDFGGTWFESAYPGCRVDTQNHLYSYSNEANHEWPQFYSDRNVLHAYFRDAAERYGIRKNTRLGTKVEEAVYDEKTHKWSVRVRDLATGREENLVANAVVSAVGQLNIPRFPDIEGQDSFKGISFHSARWRHDVDLKGKRVAVIGTGASAFQFVPEIAAQPSKLTIFQRTPPWLAPTPDYHDKVPAGKNWLLQHVPFYEAWYRFYLFWLITDGIYESVKLDKNWTGGPKAVSALNLELREALAAYIAAQVEDRPDLLDKVVPTYPPGGKRMLRDNGTWIAALKRDNVEVVDTKVVRIVPSGVELADGSIVEVDVIIYGTGYQASNFLSTFKVRGRNGVELHEQWNGDARAYLGMTVPGFPNLFTIYGPNTNIVVNGSIIFFSECAVRYIIDCFRVMLENGYDAVEVKEDVHDRFNAMIDEKNEGMAWGAPHVSSWYKNAKGRVSQNWPLPLVDYWTATRNVNPADFRFEK